MWDFLGKISEQVTRYSTFFGQLWYLCVFMFRLIVVVTIGNAVYGDERSNFECSTRIVGCESMCFNAFSKISHIRFWAFQLLAVATPSVFFHFYSLNVTGQIEKLKKEREALSLEEGENIDVVDNPKMQRDFRKMSRRKKSIGNVKVKKVYSGGDLQEVPYTRKIHYAYFVSVVFRLTTEAVFIYLGYHLFMITDSTYEKQEDKLLHDPLYKVHGDVFDFLYFRVPAMYKCMGTPEIEVACSQHESVPCWVSRPWEKTIFLRYMNTFSAICFALCALELVYLVVRGFMRSSSRRRPRLLQRAPYPRQDSVFYASAPNGNHLRNENFSAPNGHRLQNENFYPTLAVPVRLGSSELYGQERSGKEGADK